MAIRVDVKGLDSVSKELRNITRGGAKAARETMLDMGARRKGGAARTITDQQIRKVYNISQADVNAKVKGYRETGSQTVAGISIPSFVVEFEQTGTYTPVHFGMKYSGRGKNKAVTWKPLKSGGQIPLKSDNGFPVFIAAPKGVALPWARLQQKSWLKTTPGGGYRGTGWKHAPVEVIHTHLSVPQMADNAKVDPNKEAEIDKRMEQRLEYHMKRYIR